MSWTLSIWVATALMALCRGQSTVHEGNSLSASGYHLCIHNETRTVSFLVMHTTPYTVTKPCGGWLHWRTCTVTLYKMTPQTEYKTVMEQVIRCCDGYVQVGRYCARPVNRSAEFTAKAGSCPTADGLYPRSEGCVWDVDCPGWQKCCQSSGHFFCSDPTNSTTYSEIGGFRFNVTVTVKTDYQQLMASEGGHLNHTRLLQAMVLGALQSDASVYYLSSQPVHPYRTATSLLIHCNLTLSLSNVSSKLHLLLKHIQEVTSVSVEDVDECINPALHQCSPQAQCNNTEGSYRCTCHQGYTDADPSNPGAHCTASNSTRHPVGSSTVGIFNSTETSMTTGLSNTSPVPFNSSPAPAPYSNMSSTVEPPLLTTTCTAPIITSIWSANVTGTSFCVYWSSQFQTNQTYQVVVRKRSEVIHSWRISQTMKEVRGLHPGVLYNVTVTPHSCESQGVTLYVLIKTDAQTLDATMRLTNIQFTADLQNTSSQAYENLTESITREIYQSLSPEMKAMMDSGQVRIEIRSFSMGSVVVNFTIILVPSPRQHISNVSTALLHSLKNSSELTVDENNTSTNDFNECVQGENDCSQWATCENTWASYTCLCLDGFTDNDPERPGRACEAITAPTTTTNTGPTTTTMTALTTTTMTALTTTTNTAPTATTMTTPTTTTNTAPTATTNTAPTTTTNTAPTTTTNTAPTTTTNTAPTTTTNTAPTTTTNTAPTTTTMTAPTTTTNTAPTTTTNTAPTTTTNTAPTTTTNTAPTTTTMTAPTTTTNTAPTTTTNTAPTATTMTAPTTTTMTAPITTTIIAPVITTTAPTQTTTDPTTTSTATATTSAAPTTTSASPTTTTAMISLTATHTTTAAALRTSGSMLGAISVECRVAAITVTVAKDFLLSNSVRESTLYLGSPECYINGGNATHAQLTVAWDECGTVLVNNETYYTASVTLFNTMEMYTSDNGTVEVPKIRLEAPIMCTYMKSKLISANFGSMGYDMIKDLIMGSGSFQVTVQLMNGTMPLPHNSSLSSEEAVVVEVSLNTSSEQIKVVINKCWATPTRNPADISSHTFLDNSCSLNTHTKVLMNGNSSTSRVSVKIFSFVNLDVIYLHCQVQICLQVGSDTCVPDCLQRTARSSKTIATTYGSSRALLRLDEESLQEEYNTLQLAGLSCLGIGLSLFFIIGFLCLLYYQRNRIGHYNFSPKPKQENFSYLVFNT